MTEFEISASCDKIERVLCQVVGPRRYWLHTKIGGRGWAILNTQQAVKTVVIEEDRLATFVRLKIQ